MKIYFKNDCLYERNSAVINEGSNRRRRTALSLNVCSDDTDDDAEQWSSTHTTTYTVCSTHTHTYNRLLSVASG